jgi:Bacterial RNA polymerase, alpha chain C terminal domain
MKIKDIKLADSFDTVLFEKQCKMYLDQGYQPHGNLVPIDRKGACLLFALWEIPEIEFVGCELKPQECTITNNSDDFSFMLYGDLINFDSPIENLGMTVRATGFLNKNGILYLRDLLGKTEGDILRIKNLGRGSLDEIKRTLDQMGLKLKGM